MALSKILISVDESPISLQAAEVGLHLASQTGASVAFVYVNDVSSTFGSGEAGIPAADLLAAAEKEIKESLDRIMHSLSGHANHLRFIPSGSPGKEIIKTSQEWSADLIVLGTHGRTGLSRVLMGSTAEYVLRHAHCPVLVVPRAKAND